MRTALLAATLLLAGCTEPSAPPRAAPSTTSAPATTPSPSATLLVETEATSFVSPTRNIGCDLSDEYAMCLIREHAWTAPAAAGKCDGYRGFEHYDGSVLWTCETGEVFRAARVLPYGTTLRIGNLSCASERSGMTCRAGKAQHGFTLSREAYRRF